MIVSVVSERIRYAILLCLCLMVGGCVAISNDRPAPVRYDLGVMPLTSAPDLAISVANQDVLFIPAVRTSGAIQGQDIIYRYTNIQMYEARKYTESFWVQAPAEMFRIRAQQFLGQHYVVVTNSAFVGQARWTLLFSLNDFSQHFSSDQDSVGTVQLMAVLAHDGEIVAQRLFHVEHAAASPDAAGAVGALSLATNDVLVQVLAWLNDVYAREASGSGKSRQ